MTSRAWRGDQLVSCQHMHSSKCDQVAWQLGEAYQTQNKLADQLGECHSPSWLGWRYFHCWKIVRGAESLQSRAQLWRGMVEPLVHVHLQW